MQGVIRAISLAYLVFMTLLLFTADPTRLIGLHSRLLPLLRLLMPWAHLLSFLALAALALSVRWPAPRWSVVLMLVLYAGMTEIAQGFVPNRTGEWKDWFMDLAGIAVGTAICWTAAQLTGAIAKARRRRCPATPSDQWEVLQKVMSRPAVGGESWWG